MKTKLILGTLMVIVAGTVSAQQIVAKTYIEKTVVSPKAGLAIGIETANGIEVGGFYQENTLSDEYLSETVSEFTFYEKNLYGVYFNYPLRDRKWYVVKFNIRTGVSNGENFVITPSLLADLKPLRGVHVGAGLGLRAFHPTLQTSIKLKF